MFCLFIRHLHHITKQITTTWNTIHKCQQMLFNLLTLTRRKLSSRESPWFYVCLATVSPRKFNYTSTLFSCSKFLYLFWTLIAPGNKTVWQSLFWPSSLSYFIMENYPTNFAKLHRASTDGTVSCDNYFNLSKTKCYRRLIVFNASILHFVVFTCWCLTQVSETLGSNDRKKLSTT